MSNVGKRIARVNNVYKAYIPSYRYELYVFDLMRSTISSAVVIKVYLPMYIIRNSRLTISRDDIR